MAARSSNFLRLIQGRRSPARRQSQASRTRPSGAARRSSPLAQGLLAVMLLAVLAASHWLGLWPRIVDTLSGPPSRYDVSGAAHVVDGDTLRIGGVRVRLNGIDAPEKDATCTVKASGKRIACGVEAGRRLTALVNGRTVRCVGEGFDRYGRTLASCWVRDRSEDVDIGGRLVRTGWALAYRRYSNRYALDETRARIEGLGLWATEFQTPEDYRRDQRQVSRR